MQLQLLPNAISELFAQVSHSGRITLADRYGLMAAVLDESLEEEQRSAIDRLIRALYKGRLIVVDELSTIM
ncbi:hypothetical protein [Argonema galeatum]|uniref:hypothetical protein n=1 Tax=Argonema galeatum TaxID=2942762 RepID=UPI0020122C7E|nr:hypothetical protein [Argonema galeatum]MCL1467653.1 hypothetical protein [Argonema galeatum A003/A1]